jgi:hypothetical protein
MSLANLPLSMLLFGVAALASVLFLLQRLRVRYREQTVITTLFWKQALEEARARVLVRRFKHWLAYLFVLLIAALMWLGFADPQLSDAVGRDHVILLDGSANMGRGTRFAETVDLVKERVASLPRDRRRVILCGGRPRALLQRGENGLLLDARLQGVQPEACPATVEATLRSLTTDRETLFLIAGDAPISETTRDALPDHVTLSRIAPPATPGANAGITALGVGRSSSGAWEKVDVLCVITGSSDPTVSVSVGKRAVPLQSTRTRQGNRTRIVLRDVDATGELLTITIPGGDALAADDTASIRLPKRKRIRVWLDPALQAALGPVLRADPAVLLTTDRAEVAVRAATSGSDDHGPRSVPALEFVPIASQSEAILLHHTEDRSSRDVLLESFARLGLSEVDAMDVAQASGRTIAIGATPSADLRGIGVWAPLLSAKYNFVQSRSFPVFIAQAVRWLADVEPVRPFVAAGNEMRGERAAYTDAAGHRHDPIGSDFVPPHTGVYQRADGVVVAATLTSAVTTSPVLDTHEPTDTDAEGRGLDLALWLSASVLVLLMLEWFLFRTGRMP